MYTLMPLIDVPNTSISCPDDGYSEMDAPNHSLSLLVRIDLIRECSFVSGTPTAIYRIDAIENLNFLSFRW